MATNDFVPFAAGTGANALTPSAYAADPTRQAGVQSGTARSNLANTAWRQSSTVAAAFGQFIVQYANLNALDNGDIGTLVNSFAAGLRAVAATAVTVPPPVALWHYGVDTGQPGAIVANVSPDISAYTEGFVYHIRMNNNAVSGGTTANLDNRGSRSVVRADGTAVRAGDYVVGQTAILIDDGIKLQIAGLLTSNLPASASVLFTSSGLFTPPPGVTRAFVAVWGAGGGGGGAGNNAAGNGGGPGGYAEGYVDVVPGVPVTVTVGTGGQPGTAGGGNAAGGGTSSFGSLISATGGAGGLGSPSGIIAAAAAAGQGFGGSFQWQGVVGQFGYTAGTAYFGGTNGAGYQASINPPGSSAPGGAGAGAGSGGSGASTLAIGGQGANGQVRVTY